MAIMELPLRTSSLCPIRTLPWWRPLSPWSWRPPRLPAVPSNRLEPACPSMPSSMSWCSRRDRILCSSAAWPWWGAPQLALHVHTMAGAARMTALQIFSSCFSFQCQLLGCDCRRPSLMPKCPWRERGSPSIWTWEGPTIQNQSPSGYCHQSNLLHVLKSSFLFQV